MSNAVQNINLYLPEFRKKKHWLDAEKMVLVAGAALVLMAVATAVEYFQLSQLRGERAETEAQYQDVAAATRSLREQFGIQTEDPTLLANIQELQDNLDGKEALLQFLEGRELGNATGFSEHLSDLARFHVPGLSLDQISLTSGGSSVELGGQVTSPDLVTVYVRNLARGNTYAGMKFEMLNIASQAGGSGSVADGATAFDFRVRSLKE